MADRPPPGMSKAQEMVWRKKQGAAGGPPKSGPPKPGAKKGLSGKGPPAMPGSKKGPPPNPKLGGATKPKLAAGAKPPALKPPGMSKAQEIAARKKQGAAAGPPKLGPPKPGKPVGAKKAPSLEPKAAAKAVKAPPKQVGPAKPTLGAGPPKLGGATKPRAQQLAPPPAVSIGAAGVVGEEADKPAEAEVAPQLTPVVVPAAKLPEAPSTSLADVPAGQLATAPIPVALPEALVEPKLAKATEPMPAEVGAAELAAMKAAQVEAASQCQDAVTEPEQQEERPQGIADCVDESQPEGGSQATPSVAPSVAPTVALKAPASGSVLRPQPDLPSPGPADVPAAVRPALPPLPEPELEPEVVVTAETKRLWAAETVEVFLEHATEGPTAGTAVFPLSAHCCVTHTSRTAINS